MSYGEWQVMMMGAIVGAIFGIGLAICWHLADIVTVLETLSK